MLQQDLLDTLFLNRKALADVGATGNGSGNIAKAATTTTTTTNPKTSTMKDTAAAGVGADGAEKCPVDHKSREAWLAQARAAQEAQQSSQPQRSPSSIDPKSASTSTSTSTSTSVSSSSSGWGWRIPFLGSPSNSTQPQHQQQQPHSPQQIPGAPGGSLGTNRVVSTIPRSTDAGATTAACPVNHETETGADAKTGNWVYPSEKMFFDAMMRKGHDTRAADMRTVVPIHNAVNEKAWVEIKEWERPYTAESCPNGPMLYSFTGLSTKMSPKARLNTLLGYTAPFDRHDWIVDRCGTKVEYVIDFYAGKNDKAGRPSFYLDVRPKLNSWEGVRMRASRVLGLV